MDKIIHFSSPAAKWSQGLLLGNGHMGAVIYGGIWQDEIDISELTFFSGEKSLENNQMTAASAFRKMRQLLLEGKYKEATETAKGFIGIRHNYGTNLPVGKLKIDFYGEQLEDSEYSRELNIMEGIAQIQYRIGSAIYKREGFVSHPDKRLFYNIQCDEKKKISCKVYFESGAIPYESRVVGQKYIFTTKALEKIHSNGETGVALQGCIAVQARDGEIQTDVSGIRINGATEIVLSLEMKTNYGLNQEEWESISWKEDIMAYEEKRKEHRMDFRSYMERVAFSLAQADDETELMFQYGRYLLLSSSREDSPLPAHLQGVWNDHVACRIGWTCDMHLDINTQMNYWLAEPGNLSECHQPLFRWMEEESIPSGRIAAIESYGMPGWSVDLVSNPWGYAAPYWSKTISPCPTGGIWIASHYWEHYLYTRDKSFLEKRVYPILREAVDFFSQYVFQQDGFYTSGPSISPENCFLIGEEKYYFSNGCTYEILMIRELFTQYINASKELGIQNEQVKKVHQLREGLLPYRILADGSLAEWSHDFPAGDPQHRHTSHLLGVFPYSQITIEKTPELARAAEKAIALKLTPYENWEDTGWARSMLMLYAARLKDGNLAYGHIKSVQNHLTHPNFLVMHPPTRGADSFQEVYELDGNTGFSMCIIEMLMQSHDGVIQLLPALPKEWKTGFIQGIVARGGGIMNMYWENGELGKAEFIPNETEEIRVSYKDVEYRLQGVKRKMIAIERSLKGYTIFSDYI